MPRLKHLTLLAGLLTAGVLHAPHAAWAQTRIGIAAPLSGFAAILGRQMRDGARMAADEAGVTVEVADTECTAEAGATAASALAGTGVSLVVGFLCTEAIEAALPILTQAGIPVITPGVRADGLTDGRERTGWLVWRTAPRASAEQKAAAEIFTRRWRRELFALVDDGTIYGRELVESIRLQAEIDGLEPVYVDTYRPQMPNQIGLAGRLKRAGATHVFVGGDRSDIAILARDASGVQAGLTIAGGEALAEGDSETPLAEGVLMLGLPDPRDTADPAVLEAFRQAEIQPEGYVLPGYAAMQIAIQAASAGDTAREALDSTRFDTVNGPVRFDSKGDAVGNPYRLFRWTGDSFEEAKDQ